MPLRDSILSVRRLKVQKRTSQEAGKERARLTGAEGGSIIQIVTKGSPPNDAPQAGEGCC
jgi:hypothetical protein